MNSYKVTWTPENADEISALAEELRRQRFFRYENAPGVFYLPLNQGYGGTEIIHRDLRRHLPAGSLRVVEAEDPRDEPIYHR